LNNKEKATHALSAGILWMCPLSLKGKGILSIPPLQVGTDTL